MRPRRQPAAVLAGPTMLLVGSVVLLAACDIDDGREMRATPTTTVAPTTAPPPPPDPGDVVMTLPGEVVMTLPGEQIVGPTAQIIAPWADGGTIDAAFTCDGAGTAPTFTLVAPPDAAELAVTIVNDGGHVSLVVTGLPAGTEHLDLTALPPGATIEVNSMGQRSYDPLCPDAEVTGTYTATLHVLAEPVVIVPDDSVIEIFAALDAAASSTASVVGNYTGPSV